MSKPAFTFGSLFAGVGGFDLGFERAGGKCLWQVEWDKFAQGVLRRRFPGVPLFGDIRKVHADDLETPDVICYGFPCQDISQANNNRKGLDGDRSGLFYEATRLFREFARRGSGIRLTVAENVAGLLNVDDGKGLARVLRELAECGFVSGWATLDAQHFGVPQRRRRVFIVSSSGTERPERILAFTEGLRRNFEKGENKGKTGKTPANSTPSARGTSIFTPGQFGQYKTGVGTLRAHGGDLGGGSENLAVVDLYNQTAEGEVSPTLDGQQKLSVAHSGPKVIAWTQNQREEIRLLEIASALSASSRTHQTNYISQEAGIPNASGPKVIASIQDASGKNKNQNGLGVIKGDEPHYTLTGTEPHAVCAWNGDETPKHSEEVCVTLRSQQGGEGVGVAYAAQVADPICPRENRTTTNEGKKNFKTRNLIAQDFVVRKLTPVEACRLQGFPDDWNAEQELPDGTIAPVSNTQRHKQMGNAVAVPVAEWLGRQIAKELNK
jgi:DNA-cytosine methyltransferase